MKKVHGRTKRKFCMRTHINGAKALRALYRKAAKNTSKHYQKK